MVYRLIFAALILSNIIMSSVQAADSEVDKELFEGIRRGNIKTVQEMLKNGADVNCKDHIGNTPLHLAAKKGHNEAIGLLLNAGAEVDALNVWGAGAAPLHLAAWNGHKETVSYLIKHGATVNLKRGNGYTPLHDAAEKGHTDVGKLLITHNAHIHASTPHGVTPLHKAAEGGSAELLWGLMKRGASVDVKDAFGTTPLHVTAFQGHVECTNLLLIHGADINAVLTGGTFRGRTPLQLAGSMETNKLLTDWIRTHPVYFWIEK